MTSGFDKPTSVTVNLVSNSLCPSTETEFAKGMVKIAESGRNAIFHQVWVLAMFLLHCTGFPSEEDGSPMQSKCEAVCTCEPLVESSLNPTANLNPASKAVPKRLTRGTVPFFFFFFSKSL